MTGAEIKCMGGIGKKIKYVGGGGGFVKFSSPPALRISNGKALRRSDWALCNDLKCLIKRFIIKVMGKDMNWTRSLSWNSALPHECNHAISYFSSVNWLG